MFGLLWVGVLLSLFKEWWSLIFIPIDLKVFNEGQKAVCQALFVLDNKVTFINIFVRKLHPSTCLCGLTWMILLKVSWLLPNLEACGERVPIGGFGKSFYNVIACFNGNGNKLKVVFSSSVRGEVSSLWCLCHDGLTVYGPVYAEYVMWIWSATLPL